VVAASSPGGWICVHEVSSDRQACDVPAGSRPVSRAQRSTLLHRQTNERPSLPSGFGNPGRVASTFTRCGDIPKRLATSTAITSSVRESTCTT
jgi:hypothetical protein